MDTLSLGRLLWNLEKRLSRLETEWRNAKKSWRKFWHYAKRAALISMIYLLNLLAHTDTTTLISWIRSASGLMAKLLGLAI